ncbi:MAG: tRNA (adenosine(37)-N6)-threonylcarbamoyltransferase complex dimerization subunit type 1 TsaB [Coprobacillaceae bacterium]
MRTIIMDTSNTYLVVALYENDICIDYIQEMGNKKQSEYALLYLKNILEKHNLKVLDIEEMIITIGPGSYTGVRVALTIAKTLAATTNIKVKAVSSLASYAGMSKAVSVLDARSKKIFVGVYNNGKALIEEKLIDIVDFETFYKEYTEYPIVGHANLVNRTVSKVELYENIYQIAKLIRPIVDVDILVPHYIKGVEAKKLC